MNLRGVRLAHLIESDGPGGAERMVATLAASLQTAGADNLVIVPADGEGWLARELDGSGVRVESFRFGRPFSPAFARGLGATLQRNGIALAHSHEFTMAVYGAWAARRAGIPHLFTMHGSRYYAGRLQRRLAMRVAAAFSGSVVAVSHSLAQHLSRDLWLRASRVTMIPNGAALARVAQSTLRAELQLEPDDRLALAVGNLYPVKGHIHLLEALGCLRDQLPRLHVVIAGRGELQTSLEERARALGVGDRVHLLGLRSDVANVLAGADVFVLPSLSEGLPMALIEAMLAGRPIIATNVGEIGTVLRGGRDGILVPPADASALAQGLARVISDPALAQRFGASAALRAEDFSVAKMMDRYVALYQALLSPNGRGAQEWLRKAWS